ncbi:MAG: hypothetical protein GDA45_02290 [Chromatiales bacterium]|nr:hypothetical protein [Chromatiales bacterium]
MTKQEKIKQLIEMQKKFIETEQTSGVSMKEYFKPDEQSELHGYSEDYMKIAMDIVDEAHSEVGSKP